MTAYCQYGSHYTTENSPGTLMVYTDLPHGVKANTRTCQACFLDHLQKYYPDSFVTQELTRRNASSHNGIIGRSGTFYPCESTRHIETMLANTLDAPFVECKRGEYLTFDAWYTEDGPTPTREQFETAMQWCTECGVTFEDATDCWDAPWLQWREPMQKT